MRSRSFILAFAGLAVAACATGALEAQPDGVEPAHGASDGSTVPAATDAAIEAGEPAPVDRPDEPVVDAAPELDASPDASDDAAPVDATPDAPPAFVAPVLDGVIAPGEYGAHVDGQNQQLTASGQTWYLTYGPDALYIAVANANLDEAIVVYFGAAGAEAEGGTGATVGQLYDNAKPGALPFPAIAVIYAKRTYREVRRASFGAWGAAGTDLMLASSATGNVREVRVPWASVGLTSAPASFAWLGFATSAGGSVYAGLPSGNPTGAIGTTAKFTKYFAVRDATPVVGSKPFGSVLP